MCEAVYLIYYYRAHHTPLFLAALGAKDILQLFSMKVFSPEEFMCHTVMKAGSSKECTFVLEDVGHE